MSWRIDGAGGARASEGGALKGEDDHLDFPRLVFHHTRRQFALLRALIHRINGFAGPDPPVAAKVGGADDTGVA